MGNIAELIKQELRRLPYSPPENGGQDEPHFTDPSPPPTLTAEQAGHCEPPGNRDEGGAFSLGDCTLPDSPALPQASLGRCEVS